jgi:hypothetical protein
MIHTHNPSWPRKRGKTEYQVCTACGMTREYKLGVGPLSSWRSSILGDTRPLTVWTRVGRYLELILKECDQLHLHFNETLRKLG